jgi:hypothetical protein
MHAKGIADRAGRPLPAQKMMVSGGLEDILERARGIVPRRKTLRRTG